MNRLIFNNFTAHSFKDSSQIGQSFYLPQRALLDTHCDANSPVHTHDDGEIRKLGGADVTATTMDL